ncbi:hypothetical protein [Rhizobium sp. G21]|uniref:hypothetical protein n=1 Tax=Rhizobium sp. G21 TaxID=2758439 RepID=UPI0015FED67C|nr:hypothetical protein [Rhizobium sp. G21]MBB1248076.1 hypothetical protein [Rhizobium sp. G21]
MTSFSMVRSAPTFPQTIAEGDLYRRPLALAIGLQLALAAPSLIALGFDDRLLNGVSIWIKPLKFQASLIMLLATLLWLAPIVASRARASRFFRIAASTAALTSTAEILYITLQAARGRASHFNDQTAFEAAAYSVMGVGAALLVLSCLVIGVYILRRPRPDVGAGLRYGAGWGLAAGSVLTLVTAFVLASGQIDGPGHWVGGVRSDAGGLILFGWSRTGGDLRVPHFFATHIMQALPLAGLLLDRFAPKQARIGVILTLLASIALVGATFVQAVDGAPFP